MATRRRALAARRPGVAESSTGTVVDSSPPKWPADRRQGIPALCTPAFDAAVRVIDSHTGGEPTRVVIAGAPDLGDGDMASRRRRFSDCFDWLRTALIDEPRGAGSMVGALLTRSVSEEAVAGIVFFNNVGYLGMCGHGLIGVVAVLAHLGRIAPGEHFFETPVGGVRAWLVDSGEVTIENVPSRRWATGVSVEVPPYGQLVGDVAWGGNWFYLAESPLPLLTDNIAELTALCGRILSALAEQGIYGEQQTAVDHVELFAPPSDAEIADARNFVLCPGGHYDRSPCGTGTSAKLACLAAEKKLQPGAPWRQESIIGSVFHATYRLAAGVDGVIPRITGRAFITADSRLILDCRDPYRFGIHQGDRRHGEG